MSEFKKVIGDIYQLKIPFEEVFTSVFLIKDEDSYTLVDCATSKEDVTNFMIPALKDIGIAKIDNLVISHWHCDHAGGREEVERAFKGVKVFLEVDYLTKNLKIYPLKGHTKDSLGVLDTRTKTLISGDGVQFEGLDKYGCTFESQEEYECTLQRVKSDENVENLIFSHDFKPWGKSLIKGFEEKQKCLNISLRYIRRLKDESHSN